MQQIFENDFAPRWVILIFFMSLIEAIGLAIYFNAPLMDPELASMQPLYIDAQSESAAMVARPDGDCRMPDGDCQLRAASPREYIEQDRLSRHSESRQLRPAHLAHKG